MIVALPGLFSYLFLSPFQKETEVQESKPEVIKFVPPVQMADNLPSVWSLLKCLYWRALLHSLSNSFIQRLAGTSFNR